MRHLVDGLVARDCLVVQYVAAVTDGVDRGLPGADRVVRSIVRSAPTSIGMAGWLPPVSVVLGVGTWTSEPILFMALSYESARCSVEWFNMLLSGT